jgi:hypothetical protein
MLQARPQSQHIRKDAERANCGHDGELDRFTGEFPDRQVLVIAN